VALPVISPSFDGDRKLLGRPGVFLSQSADLHHNLVVFFEAAFLQKTGSQFLQGFFQPVVW
jgi:hypothetical protein